MHLGKVIPILRIFDEAKALEFYVDFLGFKVDWQHRFEANFPLYLQVSLGECALHLSEHHGDASPGAAVGAASMRGAAEVGASMRSWVGCGTCTSVTPAARVRALAVSPSAAQASMTTVSDESLVAGVRGLMVGLSDGWQ